MHLFIMYVSQPVDALKGARNILVIDILIHIHAMYTLLLMFSGIDLQPNNIFQICLARQE